MMCCTHFHHFLFDPYVKEIFVISNNTARTRSHLCGRDAGGSSVVDRPLVCSVQRVYTTQYTRCFVGLLRQASCRVSRSELSFCTQLCSVLCDASPARCVATKCLTLNTSPVVGWRVIHTRRYVFLRALREKRHEIDSPCRIFCVVRVMSASTQLQCSFGCLQIHD